MGVYLLVGAGLLFAVLFALNNLLKTLLRRPRVGFLDTLLAFLTTLVPMAGLILAQVDAETDMRLTLGALAAGGGLVVLSLLVLLLELFRPQRLKGSRGVLGLFSGLLLVAAVFIVPISADTLTPVTPTAIVQAAAPLTPEASPTPPRRPTAMPTNTDAPEAASVTASPAPTETPRSTETPSRTAFRYSTRTPTLTPSPVTPCVASVQYNLRLRAAPNRDAETLLTIPFGTRIDLYAKGLPSENDAHWWLTTYQDVEGWVDGQYLVVSAACDRLPLRDAE